MNSKETRLETRRYEVEGWELKLLLTEVIVLAGLALPWLWFLGARLPGAGAPWVDAAWKGLGFFLLGLAIYPVIRAQSRNVHGHELGFTRWIAGDLIGSGVGTIVYLMLR